MFGFVPGGSNRSKEREGANNNFLTRTIGAFSKQPKPKAGEPVQTALLTGDLFRLESQDRPPLR
ncbi:hypothetical protein DSM110093_03865 (plasmid) [Sulfitobacter sp. DSM 110093]|uniref:Uncharacterized protein n=1 Tax=Sulfitobacter dubius TaxID=218673 RepID=A0ABY3ZPC8_9RHOB|nr:hypothetical protein DSM109990_03392 [Sulfitobacter dubius]UOA33769.1 hypothetical protein DSM110093_03604 [Sulfitobacter sp. DSM 110093]UOA34030.1 hypothetical protein DSM110093_03865 [Sulfitobacter sp. DSM 110093]